MRQEIIDRINALKEVLKNNQIDYYLIPTGDFHNSEYVGDYFKVREYYSGFTGSNGSLLVSQDEVGLWTDGRYFVQAEKELEGTGIILFKMGNKDVPTISQYLQKKCEEKNIVLGFDGRVVSKSYMDGMIKQCHGKLTVRFMEDLAGDLWGNRPPMSAEKIWIHTLDYCGISLQEKVSMLRKELEKKKADAFFTSKLDAIMWLFNVRGADVACNPVALSYAFIGKKNAYIFVSEKAVDEDVRRYFEENGVTVKAYHEVFSFLKNEEKMSIGLDKQEVSYALWETVSNAHTIIEMTNPIEEWKAIKNQTETSCMKEYFIKDSVAVCKFLFDVKTKGVADELEAAAVIDGYRREIDGFLDLSFPTISAYKENAAMMHYEATKEAFAKIKKEGMLLVDSGGQYKGATTDVTRTIVMGELPEEEKKYFTLVAAGMLRLQNAVFMKGCTGRNLDILARQPLWEEYVDYKCGTGHGVGCCLNVHEGPHGIRWMYRADTIETVLKEGMAVTDEPGVYFADKFGIRTENVLLVKKIRENTDGEFLGFEPLTFVPIDLAGIDLEHMEQKDIKYLNAYHAQVYEVISPYLDDEQNAWLKEATKPL